MGRLVQLRLQPGEQIDRRGRRPWLASRLDPTVTNRGFILAGGAGASDAALLLLPAGDAVRRAAADLLRHLGQLDRVHHQRPLRRVPFPQGEGGRQLQEPRHPGMAASIIRRLSLCSFTFFSAIGFKNQNFAFF
jgi:hypothetical protein